MNIKTIILFVSLITVISCSNHEQDLKLKNQVIEILDKYNEEEAYYIFGKNDSLFYEENNQIKFHRLIKYLNENRIDVYQRVKEVDSINEIKKAIKEYKEAEIRLKKINADIIDEYSHYDVNYYEYKKADNYYFFAACNGQTLSGGNWETNNNVFISDILNTGNINKPPIVDYILQFKDQFGAKWQSPKVYVFVIKGRYADVSVFVNRLKRSGYLYNQEFK
ncbi:hypothetical protein [Aquimarina sp. 2304DJ70-9]|uniref:hypothetical protein n=1 Tax=Aquimarina penaris TaxID=3231044 RepID=UPI0034622699